MGNSKYDQWYKIHREAAISIWNKRNFLGPNADAVGIEITKRNKITTHHIYVNNKCIGLIPLTYLFHRYVDDYLKVHDKKAYIEWNKYFQEVILYLKEPEDLLKELYLEKRRNILIMDILTDKKNKSFIAYLRIEPIIKKMKLDGKLKTDSDKLNSLNSYWFDQNYQVDIHKKIIPEKFDGLLQSVNRQDEMHINRHGFVLDRTKLSWMGTPVTINSISDTPYFLTKNDLEILKFIKDTELINRWKELFLLHFDSSVLPQELEKYTYQLRTSTFGYIYDELKTNEDLLKKLENKLDSISQQGRSSMFRTDNIKYQLCIAYARRMNNFNNVTNEELLNGVLKEDILCGRYNDGMGLDYTENDLKERRPLLSEKSNAILDFLDKPLHWKWRTFFRTFSYKNNYRIEDEFLRDIFILKFHNELTSLRNETRQYFENLLSNCSKQSKIVKYTSYIKDFSDRHIRMNIESLGIIYDSEEAKTIYSKLVNRYCSIIDMYDNKIKNILENSVNNQYDININISKEISSYISKNCKTDSFGFNIGYTTDENRNPYDLYCTNAFLYDCSMDVLDMLKDKSPDLYNEWLELFSSFSFENGNNKSYEYESKAEELRSRSYAALKPYKSEFSKSQKTLLHKLNRSFK